MKKVLILIISLLLIVPGMVSAQEKTKGQKPHYKTAIGVKYYPFAVSLKTMPNRKSAFEFLGYFKDGFRLTGLYELHGMLNSDGNLKWYAGLGAHLGIGNQDQGDDFKFGVDGIIGLDYKFLSLPLNLSLDWQPALGIGDDNSFTSWGGLSVRFAF